MKNIKTAKLQAAKAFPQKRVTFALALTLVSLVAGSFLIVPAALAGKNAGEGLIDGDFEEAMLAHFEKRFFRTIDAGDQEKTALSAIFLKQMQSTRAEREAIKHKIIDLSDLVASDSASDDQIRAKLSEVRIMREKLNDSRVDTALKVRQILTPDQRKVVGERIASLLSGRGGLLRK